MTELTLTERIEKLKEIMSYLDDIAYYTLEPSNITIGEAYNYLEIVRNKFKERLKNSN